MVRLRTAYARFMQRRAYTNLLDSTATHSQKKKEAETHLIDNPRWSSNIPTLPVSLSPGTAPPELALSTTPGPIRVRKPSCLALDGQAKRRWVVGLLGAYPDLSVRVRVVTNCRVKLALEFVQPMPLMIWAAMILEIVEAIGDSVYWLDVGVLFVLQMLNVLVGFYEELQVSPQKLFLSAPLETAIAGGRNPKGFLTMT